MAYYEDSALWDYQGVLAAGWLEPGCEYRRGDVSSGFFPSLVRLLADPWQPFATAGVHTCPFCRFTGGPSQLRYEGITIAQGGTILFVPGDDRAWAAPSLIAHYVDAHGYAPPDAFQHEVIACPDMRSVPYLRRMRELGVHKLGRTDR